MKQNKSNTLGCNTAFICDLPHSKTNGQKIHDTVHAMANSHQHRPTGAKTCSPSQNYASYLQGSALGLAWFDSRILTFHIAQSFPTTINRTSGQDASGVQVVAYCRVKKKTNKQTNKETE